MELMYRNKVDEWRRRNLSNNEKSYIAHDGDQFTLNYLRSIGPEHVHFELFRRIFANDINKEYPAITKRAQNELSKDIAFLFSGSTKDIRHIGIAKKSLRNEDICFLF